MSQHTPGALPTGDAGTPTNAPTSVGLSSFPVPAALITPDGLTLRAPNILLAELLGMSIDELVGRPFADIVAPAQLARLERAIAELGVLPTRMPIRLVRTDGTTVDAKVALGHLRPLGAVPVGGWPVGQTVIMTLEDLPAEAKQIPLADRPPVEEATGLVETPNPLDAADQLLQRVGHDLRHPLTIIAGYAHLLAAKGMALDPETRDRLLQTLADAAIRAAEQVTSMMDAHHGDTAGAVNLADVAGWIEGLTSLAFESIGGILIIDIGDEVAPVDGTVLRQVLLNLVNNALTHADARGNAPMSLHVMTEQVADGLELVVTDNGNGIPDAQLQNIFQAGVRLDPTDGPGLGSGLAACRAMAEAAGGSLTAVPHDGGARFVLWLPEMVAATPDDVTSDVTSDIASDIATS